LESGSSATAPSRFKPDIAPTRTSKQSLQVADTNSEDVEGALLARHNEERAKRGLHPYRLNKVLSRVAQDCANYAAATRAFTHFPWNRTIERRVTDAGYRWEACGENGAGDVNDPTWAWLFHPGGHRDAVLHPVYTEAGFAVAKQRDGYQWWVAVYAKPATMEKPCLTPAEAEVATGLFEANIARDEKVRAERDRLDREIALLKGAGKSKDPNVVKHRDGEYRFEYVNRCVGGVCRRVQEWVWHPYARPRPNPQPEPYRVPMRRTFR
jgi:uncharacterized protein YkwD